MQQNRDNKQALKYAEKFVDAELLGFIKQIEKNNWFGTLYHHPNKKAEAEFVFTNGICLRCIEPVRGESSKNTFNKTTKFW